MTINAINTGVQALQSLAAQAQGKAAPSAQQTGSFANELQSSIRKINNLQQESASKVKRFQLGDPTVELNDVMVDMQKAGLAFQMGTQVRNKLVSAYKEIMNTPV